MGTVLCTRRKGSCGCGILYISSWRDGHSGRSSTTRNNRPRSSWTSTRTGATARLGNYCGITSFVFSATWCIPDGGHRTDSDVVTTELKPSAAAIQQLRFFRTTVAVSTTVYVYGRIRFVPEQCDGTCATSWYWLWPWGIRLQCRGGTAATIF